MKAIKMFGSSVLATLVATAFIAAGSAMAENTTLCTVDENPCAIANQLGSVHEVSVGKATLLTSAFNVECNVLFSGEIPTRLAEPLVIIGTFSYSNCEVGSSSCTLTEENGPAELKVSKGKKEERATVTGEYLVHLACGVIDCSYTGVGLIAVAKGPLISTQSNGETLMQEQSLAKEAGGLICPKETKLDITTTPLTATYISS